jgi:two-component system CitB family sensor kinase
VVTDDHLLVLNRMPVEVGGRPAGWVVTIRDRTEMEALLRQLDSVNGLTNALRAQEHEFSNRLHVLSVLLELGETEEAARYSRQLRAQTTLAVEDIRSRIASPVVVALLLAKTTVAAERDVVVRVDPESVLEETELADGPLMTVLANLIDNAVDAVAVDPRTAGQHPRGVVTVRLSEVRGQLHLRVSDTGPGIPEGLEEAVFVDGFTTKPARRGIHRGVGLALVHRLVARAGGTVTVVSSAQGAVFDVRLPVAVGSPV